MRECVAWRDRSQSQQVCGRGSILLSESLRAPPLNLALRSELLSRACPLLPPSVESATCLIRLADMALWRSVVARRFQMHEILVTSETSRCEAPQRGPRSRSSRFPWLYTPKTTGKPTRRISANATSIVGPFETCQRVLKISVVRGIPEVAGPRSKRRE